MASSRATACRWVSEGVEFFWTPAALMAAMSWAVSQEIEPLGRELLVGAAEHGQPPGDRGRGHAGLEQGALVELDVVGGDFQRGDALGLHVADEVQEVAAIGFDGVVGQQGVADPGDQRPGDAGRSLPLASRARARKAGDLVGGGGVAVEEVAALGQEGRAGRRQGREAGVGIFSMICRNDG